MNQKAQTFAALAENTASQLTKSYTEWTAFLSSMGRLYKYPYIEQVFIYAQRPEATACASYDVWNKRMGRVVRRGCKGIALPDAGENSRGLRYVFDIEDTVSRNGSRRPYVWEYLDEHEEPVTRILAEKYGITDEGGLASWRPVPRSWLPGIGRTIWRTSLPVFPAHFWRSLTS